MANYILTNKAVEDLSNIWDYTFEEWSETLADRYYYLLLDSCQDIADEKVRGRSYPEVLQDVLGINVGMHIIFFRKLKGKSVEIARILHSRMDLKNRMQE